MTPAQQAYIERRLIDIDQLSEFELYRAEDDIRGALKLLLDTQELTTAAFMAWDKKLTDRIDKRAKEIT